jgi:hypothetical protein
MARGEPGASRRTSAVFAQLAIQGQRLLCHGSPTEVLLYPGASLLTHALAERWISQQTVERCGETLGKRCRIPWLVRRLGRQVRIN